MNRKKRPTLQDVADQVGLTKMTVSRYLREPSRVSEQTGARIAEALETLGYIPNRAPDILSNAKSRAIGVLVPSLTNQVFAEVIRGIESVTAPAGYQTMLAHYGYDAEVEQERITALLSYHVDALLLSESEHSERTLRMVETAGIPVVEMMDVVAEPIQQSVGVDNEAAAYAMVSAMIAKGYRHIVYLGARMDRRTRLRQQGYEAAMAAHGLQAATVATPQPSNFSLGAQLLDQALARYPQMDAVFCTNDDLAAGVVFECQRRGMAVPGQLGVAGFHGLDFGQAMSPQLATVMTPRFDIGARAAQRVLAQLDQDAPVGENEVLPYQLALTGSL
ncbi:substrate-binding domain-containing protein [Ferrimonas marina]|uniref:Transcriptional regulator, LacI family n=1 Tax=Ferrimonas marina TaxID=299255 RepID=A0A1M5ZF34_9GAMM|nr:substrate-binding domain-containing protein [Ferrimonas marina]SHI22794.1 transcriptional regulator, LacI family [Ferrimonas marina]